MSADGRTHWAKRPERGNAALMNLTAWAVRRLGRRIMAPVLHFIVLYFYSTDASSRRAIAQYQHRLIAHAGRPTLFPARLAVYRQYVAFADMLLDKLDVWRGKITGKDLDIHDPDDLYSQVGKGARGQILICSHLGNLDICHAMAKRTNALPLNVLVHHHNAVRLNRLLAQAGASDLNLIQISELDAGVMLGLSQRVERGEWLAIAADRIPLKGNRTVMVDFLGAPALFPQGPWLLAGLLRCPVNTLFCTRQQGRYRLAIRRLSDGLHWTRATRQREIQYWAQRYAEDLADACAEAPLQWFNFYPYWSDHA